MTCTVQREAMGLVIPSLHHGPSCDQQCAHLTVIDTTGLATHYEASQTERSTKVSITLKSESITSSDDFLAAVTAAIAHYGNTGGAYLNVIVGYCCRNS